MGLLELQGAGGIILNVVGLLLIVGRFAHAYGISRIPEDTKARVLGMALTFTAMIITILSLLAIALFG